MDKNKFIAKIIGIIITLLIILMILFIILNKEQHKFKTDNTIQNNNTYSEILLYVVFKTTSDNANTTAQKRKSQ